MNNTRRKFIKKIGKSGAYCLTSSFLVSCINSASTSSQENTKKSKYKISLAQWSLHSALFSKEISNLDFPRVTREKFGIEAVEYVSQFFQDKAKDNAYLKELKNIADNEGVKNVLIMVDKEGSLASTDTKERMEAVENHYKWVDAAKEIGCESIRVNLHGHGGEDEWLEGSIEGLAKLVEYGAANELNILVENHGQWSSKGVLVKQVMDQIDSPWCGTLPDFGNFCVRRRDGDLWVSPCIETYDMYKGIEEMMPYAKGVSAKTFAFDEQGNETTIDFDRMMKIVNDSGYDGYIGVEYEGGTVDEDTGVKLTKALIERSIANL